MGVVKLNTNPTRRQLGQFAVLWLAFFGLLGAVALFKMSRPPLAIFLWVLALTVPAIGRLSPRFMRLVFVGMSLAAYPIGYVVSHVVLAMVFFGVLTPIGLLMRLFGYDPMKRRFDAGAVSYWVARDRSGSDPKRYFRQF